MLTKIEVVKQDKGIVFITFTNHDSSIYKDMIFLASDLTDYFIETDNGKIITINPYGTIVIMNITDFKDLFKHIDKYISDRYLVDSKDHFGISFDKHCVYYID